MDETHQQDATLHFLDYWRVLRARKEIIITVTLLVVLSGTLFTLTLPQIFRAETRIRVQQDALSMDVFDREYRQAYNPFFLRTEYEVIQSRKTLNKVIANLNLAGIWGERYNESGEPLDPERVYQMLAQRVQVDQYRNTSLIAILATGEDKLETVRIANEVANVYRDWRLSAKHDEISGAIAVLKSELAKQQEKVNQAEKEQEDIRKNLGVQFAMGGVLMDTARLQKLEMDRSNAQVEMVVRKARYDQLKNLEGEDLLNTATHLVNDTALVAIRRQLVDSEVTLKLLMESYGVNHPEVRRVQAAVDELLVKLGQALAGLKRGLAADYEVSLAKLNALETQLEAIQAQNIDAAREQYLPFKRAERNVTVQRSILEALQSRIAQEGIELNVPRTPVEIIDHATMPTKPISPNFTLNIIMSLLLGMASGIGLAFFIEYLDTSVKTVDDVERFLGLSVVGVIPQKVHILMEAGLESQHAEAYRVLRTNLQFSTEGGRGGAFTVTSGGVGEGKSTTLANLAFICASLGDRVLVIDSDMRRPVQHKILGASNRVGLTDVLTGGMELEDVIQPTKEPNLHFMPSGKLARSMVGVLDQQRLKDLIKELRNRYDYVFFDSPPLMGISDASVLASEVDGVLLVVQYRKYPKLISARAKRILDSVGARTVGVVLNNINIMRDDYYYYYHTSGSYHQDPADAAPEPKVLAEAGKSADTL